MKYNKIITCGIITIIVAFLLVIWAVLLPITGNEMGYGLISYYLIFPLLSLICGGFIGLEKSSLKWLYIPFVGLLGILMPYLTFHTIQLHVGYMAMVPAGVCLVSCTIIRMIRARQSQQG